MEHWPQTEASVFHPPQWSPYSPTCRPAWCSFSSRTRGMWRLNIKFNYWVNSIEQTGQTPKWHQNGVEDRAGVVKEIGESKVSTLPGQSPGGTVFAERTHTKAAIRLDWSSLEVSYQLYFPTGVLQTSWAVVFWSSVARPVMKTTTPTRDTGSSQPV